VRIREKKVEDVVDEFQLKAEKYEADGDGGFVSKYLPWPFVSRRKSFEYRLDGPKDDQQTTLTANMTEC
jgi:hypothetical protein